MSPGSLDCLHDKGSAPLSNFQEKDHFPGEWHSLPPLLTEGGRVTGTRKGWDLGCVCDCFMDGTKELRTQNPVVTGVLVLEAMTLSLCSIF